MNLQYCTLHTSLSIQMRKPSKTTGGGTEKKNQINTILCKTLDTIDNVDEHVIVTYESELVAMAEQLDHVGAYSFYIRLATVFGLRCDHDKVKYYLDRIIALYRNNENRIMDLTETQECYFRLATVFERRRVHDKMKYYLDQILTMYDNANRMMDVEVAHDLFFIYLRNKEYQSAMLVYRKHNLQGNLSMIDALAAVEVMNRNTKVDQNYSRRILEDHGWVKEEKTCDEADEFSSTTVQNTRIPFTR